MRVKYWSIILLVMERVRQKAKSSLIYSVINNQSHGRLMTILEAKNGLGKVIRSWNFEFHEIPDSTALNGGQLSMHGPAEFLGYGFWSRLVRHYRIFRSIIAESVTTKFIKTKSPFCLTHSVTRSMIGPCTTTLSLVWRDSSRRYARCVFLELVVI